MFTLGFATAGPARRPRPAPLTVLLAGVAFVLSCAGPAFSLALQPGWPRSTVGGITGSPALGDLDGDGDLEIVVPCERAVYAWHHDGTPVAGWPRAVGGNVHSPVLANLDGDGDLHVIAGCDDRNVYAWHGNGTPVAGWPQSTGNDTPGSLTIADLNADGQLEVMVGSSSERTYAWHRDGTPLVTNSGVNGAKSIALADLDGDSKLELVATGWSELIQVYDSDQRWATGWPQTFGPFLYGALPALGDLDKDGLAEVVVAGSDGDVGAWQGDGSLLPGWPVRAGHAPSPPVLGDVDGDGETEVVVCAANMIFAWHSDGSPVAGSPWPVPFLCDTPVLGDVDGDGNPEIIVSCWDTLCAYRGDGSPVPGWPLAAPDSVAGSPVLGDLDGDGSLEVVVGAWPNNVYVWTCGTPTRDWLAWPMDRHDPQRTGCYSGTAQLSSGYVTPQSGNGSTRFTWRVKYWNTASVPPDRVMLGIWSSAGISWRRMWEYNPSDADCKDGKWYTSSAYLPGGGYAYRFAAHAGGASVVWPLPAGTYRPGPLVTPVLLSGGSVTPESGAGSTEFSWQVRYYNTDNAPPDEILVAIWFPTLRRAYWYPMQATDPADTNYRDGAWFALARSRLPQGGYHYRFAARQGAHWAYWPEPTGTYTGGPTVGP